MSRREESPANRFVREAAKNVLWDVALNLLYSTVLSWAHGAKRRKAIERAIADMPDAEYEEYRIGTGRYRRPGAVPQCLPREYLTDAELGRWSNRTHEFSPDGRYDTS